jgi:hypothetical protein
MQYDFIDIILPPRYEMAEFVMPSPRYPLRDRISISFSGGATSGYMLKMLLNHFRANDPDRELCITFCNTGLEHEETLIFVQRCAEEFDADVVWLEAVVTHGERIGIRHRIVNFETASRNGEPFEEYIKKHGIPNAAFPQCNSRLKLDVMESYRRAIGWKPNTYSTAIGIRADEVDRVSFSGMSEMGLFYPCVDTGITKRDVKAWWSTQSFRLNIPEHYGNCVTCWKKTNRKLLTIAKENSSAFDFMKRMEEQHPFAGGPRRDGEQMMKPRLFFRNNMSAIDILEASKRPFIPFVDGKFIPFDDQMDLGGGCGDSCEVGAD